jgi:hypothetical protein
VTKGKTEMARDILVRLHVTKQDPHDHTYAVHEYEAIVKQEKIDSQQNIGWTDLFSKKYRKRSCLAFIAMFSYAGTGSVNS